jgi:hypothetical protein
MVSELAWFIATIKTSAARQQDSGGAPIAIISSIRRGSPIIGLRASIMGTNFQHAGLSLATKGLLLGHAGRTLVWPRW